MKNAIEKLADKLNAERVGSGWRAKCLFPDRHRNQDASPSLSIFKAQNGGPMLKCQTGCSTSAELMAEAKKRGLLPDDGGAMAKPAKRRVAATYDYTDRQGNLRFQVVRYDPKDFRQRRPDGHGGWVWKVPPKVRVPYRLPQVVAANANTRIYVVEGEKDVDSLVGLGLLSTCNPGGAGKWEPKYTKALKGKRVVVFGDNDSAGQKHTHKVAAALYGKAASVRVMFAPAPYKDAAEWIEAGAKAKDVRRLAKSAPKWTPDLAKSLGPLVLDPSDPLPTARKFIAGNFTRERKNTLLFHQGDFRAWTGTYYKIVAPNQLRACLYRFLETAIVETTAGPDAFKPNSGKVNSVVDALKAEAILPEETLVPTWRVGNKDKPLPEAILSCANGLLQIAAWELLPHTPNFYNHHALDYAFDPDAPKPRLWLRFLRQLWPKDKKARKTLQEMFGYFLGTDTRQQKIFLIVGPKRSGKGTIARLLTALVGAANVSNPTLNHLTREFGLASLIGKSLAIIGDARLGGKADQSTIAERLLSISGEDSITIARKYQEDWTGRLVIRFLILSNELPRLADTSGALASRFVPLILTESFFGKEDKSLTEKLLAELPGILNWAVRGWKRLQKRGQFVQAKSSLAALQELEDLGSPMSIFLRERCTTGPVKTEECSLLFEAWKTWCETQGRKHPGTIQSFGRDLRAALPGLKIRRASKNGSRHRAYQGVELQHKFAVE